MYTTILDIAHGIIQIGGAFLVIVAVFISFGILAAVVTANKAAKRVNKIVEKCEEWVSFPMGALLSFANNKMMQSDYNEGCSNKQSCCNGQCKKV